MNCRIDLIAASLALLALPACNIVAPIYAVASGPGEVKAAYDGLDPQTNTVIFVDDPANQIAQRRIRAQIGVAAQDELLKRKIVREGFVIDSRSALAVADQRGDDGLLSVTEIGRALDADVVIYVLVTRFDMTSDGIDFNPTAEIEVKILDTVADTRVWPPEGQPGYRATFARPSGDRTTPTSRTALLQAEMELAEITGLGLAQLFYDVERPQSLRQ